RDAGTSVKQRRRRDRVGAARRALKILPLPPSGESARRPSMEQQSLMQGVVRVRAPALGRHTTKKSSELPVEPTWWRWFLVALFAVALAWRCVVLLRLSRTPLLGMLTADSKTYWEGATAIRAGEWVPRGPFFLGPLYPYWLAALRTVVGDDVRIVLLI